MSTRLNKPRPAPLHTVATLIEILRHCEPCQTHSRILYNLSPPQRHQMALILPARAWCLLQVQWSHVDLPHCASRRGTRISYLPNPVQLLGGNLSRERWTPHDLRWQCARSTFIHMNLRGCKCSDYTRRVSQRLDRWKRSPNFSTQVICGSFQVWHSPISSHPHNCSQQLSAATRKPSYISRVTFDTHFFFAQHVPIVMKY